MTQPPRSQRNDFGQIEQSGGIASHGSNYYNSTINNTINGDAKETSAAAARSTLLHMFGPLNPASEKARILHGKDPLLKDSCSWVFRDAAFEAWLGASADSSILWIHGNPGKGKTMIAAAATDEVASQTRSHAPLAFFFCQRGDERLSNACAVVKGLIRSLVQHERVDPQKVLKRIGEHLDDDQFWNLWATLDTVLEILSLPKVYFIIDALDECSHNLADLLECIVRYPRKSTVRWLLTSRNEPYIRERLEYDNQAGIHMSLEINAESVRLTVLSYIDWKVLELQRRKRYPDALSAEVKRYLRENSQGTFLWVALVTQELSKVDLRNTKRKLYEYPPGLPPLYDQMLLQVESQNDEKNMHLCLQLLRVVTLAFRPLSLKDLAALCALPESGLDQSLFAEDLVQRCGSFINIQEDGSVTFVHQSSSDFFLQEKGQRLFPEGIPKAHLHLSEACRAAMSRSLKRNICDVTRLDLPAWLIDEKLVAKRIPSWLRYACTSCVSHYHRYVAPSGISPPHNYSHPSERGPFETNNQNLLAFFQKNFLPWIEVLLLTRDMESLEWNLRVLKYLLARAAVASSRGDRRSQGDSEIPAQAYRQFQDALQAVALGIRELERAPLQLYVGLIASEVSDGWINLNFRRMLPDWLKAPAQTSAQFQMTSKDESNVEFQFSPCGSFVACVSSNGYRRIYHAGTAQLWVDLPKERASYHQALAFSPSGKFIFTLANLGKDLGGDIFAQSRDRLTKLEVWEFNGPSKIGEHPKRLWAEVLDARHNKGQIGIHPKEDLLAFALQNGHIVFRRWKDGRQTEVIEEKRDAGKQEWVLPRAIPYAFMVCFSPDGSVLAVEDRDFVRLLHQDCSETSFLRVSDVLVLRNIAFSADSKYVVLGDDMSEFSIWNVRPGVCQKIFSAFHPHNMISWRPGNDLTLATGGHGRIFIWRFKREESRRGNGKERGAHDQPEKDEVYPRWSECSGINQPHLLASNSDALAEVLDMDTIENEVRPPLWSDNGKLVTSGEVALAKAALGRVELDNLKSFFCVDTSRTWITAQGRPVVRLHFQARSWAMHGSTIVIAGHDTGIRFYHLDERKYLGARLRHPSALR